MERSPVSIQRNGVKPFSLLLARKTAVFHGGQKDTEQRDQKQEGQLGCSVSSTG